MVDNAASLPGGVDPGGPRRPGPGRGRRHKRPPEPRPRRAGNPPQIDLVNAASPIEETPEDFANKGSVFSTGQGGVEMYHYHREPMRSQEQLARPESETVTGPGQP